jgi:RNA polymerase sigma factor (sigma-70 family)
MDEEALRAELEKHHREGYIWALNCCSQNPVAAEDVLQKVYLKILAGRARFRGESNFKTWLLALVRNTAADQWRQESRHEERLIRYERTAETWSAAERPDELLQRGQLHTALKQALSGLSDRQQEVMRLVFYHDLSLSESAAIMGISVGTARTHYERGKDQLRKFLEAAKVIDGPELGRKPN